MHLIELDPRTAPDDIAFYVAKLYSELFGPQAVLSEDVTHQVFAQWQQRSAKHRAFKVVDESGAVVAFFTLAESFAFFAHGAYGIVNELWVAPEHRSKGVGGEVLDLIKRLARDSGWERVDVSAPPDDKWIRSFEFYKKYGFTFTGKKLKFVSNS